MYIRLNWYDINLRLMPPVFHAKATLLLLAFRENLITHISDGCVNTLRPGQNGLHVVNDIFKCIFLMESIWIPTKISLNYVPYGLIDIMAALVQIMAWHRPGDKPLSELMMGKFWWCIYASLGRSEFEQVPKPSVLVLDQTHVVQIAEACVGSTKC